MHKVILVNRALGTSQSVYPVCGKSGKNYGQAHPEPNRAGMVLEMSSEDYARDAYDITTNPSPMQCWTPFFEEDEIVKPLETPVPVRSDSLGGRPINELRSISKALGYTGRNVTKDATLDIIRGQLHPEDAAQ